jgi:hypothetical protein
MHITHVIYGVPITKKLCENMPVLYDDLEGYGFRLLYSGNSDHQVGFLGVYLGCFDETFEAIAVGKSVMVLNEDGTKVEICSTTENKAEMKKLVKELPDNLREAVKIYGEPVGVYIIWSTE